MGTDSEFFDELKEWSERKLTMLTKYLDASSRILGSTRNPGQLYYIDGFAGRGYYGKPDETQVPGSPVRAAQLARQAKDEGRNYRLYCINIESNPVNYSHLVGAMKPYSDVATNLCGPFVDQVDTLLKMVGSNPVLCFLDPFGIDGMDMSALARLIQRGNVATDMLVRFDVGEARRRDGYYTSPDLSAPKQYDILCRLYGIADRDQLRTALDGPTAEDRHLAAVRLYMRRLGEQYLSLGNAYTSAYHIRSVTGASKYWMVATTRHAKGYVLASDIIYSTDETYDLQVEWYRKATNGGQLSLLDAIQPTEQQIFDEIVSQIEQFMSSQFSGKRATRLDIHVAVLRNEWFGRITKKHVNKALRNMHDKGLCTANSTVLSDDDTIFTFR